jgi:hypothetical protein
MKSDQKDHPILEIERFVGHKIAPEHYTSLEQERDKVFEKAIILYDAALASPLAYRAIIEDAANRKLYDKTDKMKTDGTLDQNSLLGKYVELSEYVRYAHDRYDQQYNKYFAAEISGTAVDARIIIEKAVEKALKPKKSVTIREDLNQKIETTTEDNKDNGGGEWVRKIKRQKLSPTLTETKNNV